MTRFVLHVSAALALLVDETPIAEGHQLFAPTLVRSQLLSALHEAVRRGELPAEEARARLTRFRELPIRLLGDSVLQRTAWRVADRLGWDSTYDAEYVGLTQLQADALVTVDP